MRSLDHRIPPPFVAVAAAALMWGASWVHSPLAHSPIATALAVAVGLAGLVCTAAGLLAFSRAKTTTNPFKPEEASALVTGGIYRLTRNPIYLGLATILLAWAIYLSSPLALVALPLFVWYMNRFQIGPEERALTGLFGEEYIAYCGRVRRWL